MKNQQQSEKTVSQILENYEVIAHIGKGSFGVVTKVRRKNDNKNLVWKELNYGKMSEREKKQLVFEVNILRELKHPNIVRYYDRIIDKKLQKIYIIQELCEGGDLGALLKKCRKEKDYIAEDVIWKVFTQILLALNECHNKEKGKILHRDLKPANIFLDSQNNVKLGDFGLAKMMGEESEFAKTHVGTPYYMSPEQITEQKYNEKSDIWSAGCLLYEMAALKPPFEASNHLTLAIKIKGAKFERVPMRYSEELQNVIEAMLQVDQNRRPNVNVLMSHPFIALRIQEKEIRERHAQVKDKEKVIKDKEQTLKNKEALVVQKKEKIEQLKLKLQQQQTGPQCQQNFYFNSNRKRSDSNQKSLNNISNLKPYKQQDNVNFKTDGF